jgi:hypothetical protein
MKPAPRTITLNRTSIEDYLLVPRAIKAAIPSISLDESGIKDFLDANSAEKSKKKVLDQMLQQYSGIRYNRRIGSKIASRMKLLEMDKEIRDMFMSLHIDWRGRSKKTPLRNSVKPY